MKVKPNGKSHVNSARFGCAILVAAMLAGGTQAGYSHAVNLADLPVQANRESEAAGPPDKEKDPHLLINKTANGKPLTLGTKTYGTGLLALHGSLSWSYILKGEYSGLSMDLGQEGTATLRVLGDGKLLYDAGRLPVQGHLTALVDVRTVKDLQLAVSDNDGGFWNDRVVIGNPVLTKRPLPDAADAPGRGNTTPPRARMVVTPVDGVAPLAVSFTGDQSTAPAGQVGRYTWYFGDGATESLAPNPTHTYSAPGLYEVLLQAEDDKGGVGVARQLVRVRPGEAQPPIASMKASSRLVRIAEPVEFDGQQSSSADGVITGYQWDFGDGQKADGEKVAHAYANIGRYLVTLAVRNKAGNVARVTASVRVTGPGEPPVFPLKRGARVLLIGNSLLEFCGPMGRWLMAFDQLSPRRLGLEAQARGKGLGKLVEYATWARLAIHDKIDEGWDVVIIEPWVDALDPAVSDQELLKQCKTLVDWAREVGAYPVLYEPQFGWQKQASDQARGHARIAMMADKLDTGFIPAGQAWLQVAKDFPMKIPGFERGVKETDPDTLDGLMYSDFGHQSFSGALFNALMVWRYLTGASASTIHISPGDKEVDDESRHYIQWDKLPYLEKTADRMITPAAQRVR